ncbi:TetR/AcrR family transcriptional regulator C-terminal domain-containing protein [Agromyces sp. SYSU K20354]|uniref:TetR/AcrR family transcriptional regulator n=1 Tax=Agromyces cavernae TaxID=2898659 RepID=UPI001E2C6CB5|nr:TetR/AcrR family transcriptional regulator C-terminal domain-containing protein [Agromyces cavernae]MCD2443342.1 TetR/AcrR family transcriptional regulator C-terminal domain-containing protein [Agromyces cavernae]
MPRPRTPILSTERIADAAMELVDEGAPFGVNAIARRLGVTASSLYNHVAGRDEIIELMRGRLGERYMSATITGTWDEVVEATLRAERRMYADHAFLIPLIVGTTITDPTVIASYDRLATTLADAGFPDEDVLEVVAIIDAFSIGFGLDLASPDDVWRPETATKTLGRLVETGDRGRPRSDRAFESGVELLLDGLRLRLARYELD